MFLESKSRWWLSALDLHSGALVWKLVVYDSESAAVSELTPEQAAQPMYSDDDSDGEDVRVFKETVVGKPHLLHTWGCSVRNGGLYLCGSISPFGEDIQVPAVWGMCGVLLLSSDHQWL